jgi:serine/threonine protein kinase
MRGGAIIGRGTYGVVNYPAIPCRDTDDDADVGLVSKLMSTEDADTEYSETKEVSEIAQRTIGKEASIRYFTFPVGPPCMISKEEVSKQSVHAYEDQSLGSALEIIRSAIEHPDNYRVLHMPYGGTDGKGFTSAAIERNDMPALNRFKESLIETFENGLLPLNNKGVYHKDLKLDNVVVNDDEVRIVDWGLGLVSRSPYRDSLNHNDDKYVIPGHVQWNAPTSGPMMVDYDVVMDKPEWQHLMDKVQDATRDGDGGPKSHKDWIVYLLRQACQGKEGKTVETVLTQYQKDLQDKYWSKSQRTVLPERKESFYEAYHRGVDVWGLVMCFVALALSSPEIPGSAREPALEALLMLYTPESIAMDDEQVDVIMAKLREITF